MGNEAIYLLHGLGASGRSYDRLLKTNKLQAYNVTAFDYAGYGRRVTERASGDPIEYAVAELIDYTKKHKIDRVLAVGHSLGGAVAIRFAAAMPGNVAGLVSIEGNMIAEDCGLMSRKLASAPDAPTVVRYRSELIEAVKNPPRAGWERWIEDVSRVAPETLSAYAKSLVVHSDSGNLLSLFNSFNGVKGFIYGDDYVAHPLLARIEGDVTHFVPDSGHLIIEDQPERSAQLICQFAQNTFASAATR